MKILKSYKKMAKSMLTEHAWDRKFGEPLPTLEDTAKKHQTNEEPGQGGGGHKEGDVWQTDSGWAAWKPGEKSAEYGIKDKGAAEKYAKGEKVGYDDGDNDEEEPAGKLGGGDFDRDGGDSDDTAGGDKKTGFTSKNKPQKAKDLANDPSVDTGPDSRGTEWSGDYYGSDDSAEWQDDYEEAEEDDDKEKLAQIKWFGEKQGWGDKGELGKNETLEINGKQYKEVKEEKKVTKKHILRENYERFNGK